MGTVVIGGAGPTGLMLACELRLAGVDVTLLDALPGRTGESRAGGLHPRTMEVLEQRGILDRFLAVGRPLQAGHFSGLRLDFSRFATRYPYSLLILQAAVEQLLEQRATELGVQVRWSAPIVAVEPDEHSVTVEIGAATSTGTERLTADYLVGCDGGRSAVRKLVGIDFPGTSATMSSILGDVELASPPADQIAMKRLNQGQFSVLAFQPDCFRVIVSEYDRVIDRDAGVSFEDLRQAMIRVAGTDYGMHRLRWISRFTDAARQASTYRRGRVLLAGDAAHIHYPAGGQGQNLGLQDAVNLGWKLALVARGQAPADLLDSYHAERHPVAERVLQNTRAQTVLSRPGEQTTALREVFGNLLQLDDVNAHLAGLINALDLHYPIGAGPDPLIGRRMPDLDLKTPAGGTRMFTLLNTGRPVLLELDPQPPGGHQQRLRLETAGWTDRIDVVLAWSSQDRVQIPGVGEITLPSALLVRPDGYVAWTAPSGAAELDVPGLRQALNTWFGPETFSR